MVQLGHEVIRGDREGNVPRDIDYVFDLASYGNLWHQKYKYKIWEANLYRVEKLLRNALGRELKGIVLMSTSSVSLPILTEYAKAKKEMEKLPNRFESLPIIVVRPYTIYGPEDNSAHLIPTIFRSCLKGNVMSLDPNPVHDYVYVDDVIDAFLLITNKIDKFKGKIVHIGTAKQNTNGDIVKMIEMITGKKANVKTRVKMREYDTDKWCANIAEITKHGWLPKISITEGLYKIYEDYKHGLKT